MKGDSDKEEIARSIRLPKEVWAALDTDAKRCKRSPVRQLEALLSKWYALNDVDIHFDNDLQQGESDNSTEEGLIGTGSQS